ncbi:MAG: diadenylate cyclase [Candidatus Dojkabacteria bacterium]|jgi:hypothetical protein|nr:diadenylate cyclase [Candidatus Dojkabacteria bacterium]
MTRQQLIKQNPIAKQLFITIEEVKSSVSKKDFSGLGILIYKPEYIQVQKFISLRPSNAPPEGLFLGDDKTSLYLSQISSKYHELHDGFVFFNSDGLLTHISQWIEVRAEQNVQIDGNKGTRYLSALFASKQREVLLTAGIGSDMSKYLFLLGNIFTF